jgi:hypothetical protein
VCSFLRQVAFGSVNLATINQTFQSQLFLHPNIKLSSNDNGNKVIEGRNVKQHHGQPGTTNPKKKMEQCEFSKRNRSRFTVMLVGKSASPAFYII